MLQDQVKQSVQSIESTIPAIANGNDRWTSRTTIAFPADWPMKADSPLVAYGYVYRHPESGADFEEQCGPFCKVIITPGSSELHSEKLAMSIENDVFRQGVRAVMKNEVPDYEKLEGMLSQSGQSGQSDELKAGYQFWVQQNSALAQRIKPHHQAFFDWLES